MDDTPSSLPTDNHVHTEWSWDASTGDMRRSCEVALSIGLPSVAFTDHADFTRWAFPGTAKETSVVRVIDTHARSGFLDPAGYWECLDRCRSAYPSLRILSGVELGEAHLFPEQAAEVLGTGSFDRILGSLHSLPVDGVIHYAPSLVTASNAHEIMRDYLAESLRMIEGSGVFAILAHLDYPMRAWPKSAPPFRAADFEEEYRAVLGALARSGRALEVNTAGPWPAPEVVKWWYEERGSAVSFGSDAHQPSDLAKRFRDAVAMVEAIGFRRPRQGNDFWIR